MKILFMCVANSARSQMAEGFAKRLLPNAEIYSAGSKPGQLNPFAVEVMQEIGIEIRSHFSKSTKDLPLEFLGAVDFVITLCSEEVCPQILAPMAKKLHWPFPDPVQSIELPPEEIRDRFREIRDLIRKKIQAFSLEVLHEPR